MINMNDNKNFKLKNKLTIPLLVGFVCIIITFIGSLYAIHLHLETDNLERIRQELHRSLAIHQTQLLQEIEATASILTQVDALQRPFRQQDRDGLLRVAQPLFQHLRDHHAITHLYFHTPEMITFLRVHQPDRHGDHITRIVNQQAWQTTQPSQGVELGPLGTLTLRIVLPWSDPSGNLLGFLELGKEFNLVMQGMITDIMVVQLHLFLNKSMIHKKEWLKQQQISHLSSDHWEQFNNWVQVGDPDKRHPLPDLDLDRDLIPTDPGLIHRIQRMVLGTFHRHTLLLPVQDVTGQEAGRILAVIDEQQLRDMARSHLVLMVPGVMIVGSLLIWFFMTTLGKVEDNLERQGAQLLEAARTHQEDAKNMRVLERQYRLLLEAVGDGIFGVDRDGRTTFINQRGAELLGFAPSALIGQAHHALIHHTRPDGSCYPFESCPTHAAIRSGATRYSDDELFWRQDGSSFPVEYTATPVIDDHAIQGAVVVFRDISARQAAERQIQQNLVFKQVINRIYAASMEPIPLAAQLDLALEAILTIPWLFVQSKGLIFLVDPDDPDCLRLTAHRGVGRTLVQRCTRVSFGHCLCGQGAMERTILYIPCVDERHTIRFRDMEPHGHYVVPLLAREQLLGVMTFYLNPGHPQLPAEEEMLRGLAHTLAAIMERWQNQEQLRHHNQILEARVQERTQELKRNLEEMHHYQEQLIRSERMAALGSMVAGISHELNTPIGIGYTASTYLQDRLARFEMLHDQQSLSHEEREKFLTDANESVRLVLTNLARANELIFSFKSVAVDQTSEAQRRIHVKEYLELIVQSLRPKLRQHPHRIVIDCPQELEWTTWPGSLAQVLTNLVLNSLTHAFVPGQTGLIRIHTALENQHLLIQYQDNGQGLTPEVRKCIFEPFFTTRRGEGGCGLGMHLVYNIITQKMGGTIQCGSSAEEGAVFRMSLPVRDDQQHQETARKPRSAETAPLRNRGGRADRSPDPMEPPQSRV